MLQMKTLRLSLEVIGVNDKLNRMSGLFNDSDSKNNDLYLSVSHFTKFLILFLALLSTGTADVTLKIEDQNGKPVQDAVIWVPGIGKPAPTTATICQKQR